ncbi:MAG: phytanoyl-CoA dioxygenase family protein [Gammaproteobacteria bacterium]|nr:phytanoyl-CoA dioxygenase family protein [Gammaproteobacteria bacterium]
MNTQIDISEVADDRWLESRVAGGSAGRVLDEAHVSSWRERGFAFVGEFFPSKLLSELEAAARERFPEADTSQAEKFTNFGGPLHFPSSSQALNDVTLHPQLLTAVAELLDVQPANLRLTQSDLWPKYGRPEKLGGELDNSDQRIHVDYPNHNLAHPTEWSRPEAVELVVYLSDVKDCGGATAVVPRQGEDDPAYRWPIVDSPGIGDLDYVNDRGAAETYFAKQRPALGDWRQSLYEREHYTRFKRGDVLFYRQDTWHRGTLMVSGALRLVQNIAFRRAESEWISTVHVGWSWSAYRRDKMLERLIAAASLDQRAVLGFPQPGSPYWTEATITAVAARHGVFGMDMTPYREALELSTAD